MSFVGSHSDLYYASGTAAMYKMSCNIESLYNGTLLHYIYIILIAFDVLGSNIINEVIKIGMTHIHGY